VVAITPETGSAGIGTGGFQELDQMSMFEKSCVYQVRVNRPERMAELTRRAFYMAKAENGPVQLNIPRDYFYGICEDEIYPTLTVSRGCGARKYLDDAAGLLTDAQYPVIVAGGGVSQGGALAVGPIGYCGSKAAVREKIPVIAVVANKLEWGAEKKTRSTITTTVLWGQISGRTLIMQN